MIRSRAGRVEQENGAIFEALRTMSACYLRADTAAICACIQAFALNDLLFSIARLERLFNKRSCNGAVPSRMGSWRTCWVQPWTGGYSRSSHVSWLLALLALHAGSEMFALAPVRQAP